MIFLTKSISQRQSQQETKNSKKAKEKNNFFVDFIQELYLKRLYLFYRNLEIKSKKNEKDSDSQLTQIPQTDDKLDSNWLVNFYLWIHFLDAKNLNHLINELIKSYQAYFSKVGGVQSDDSQDIIKMLKIANVHRFTRFYKIYDSEDAPQIDFKKDFHEIKDDNNWKINQR